MLEKLFHWSNEQYRNALLMFYALVFGYLGLQSMLVLYAGAAAVVMTIVAFFAIFTFVYWQPALGLMAALVEFRIKSDDPKQKSTWRLYLMIVLASIMIGQLAIILQMIGAGHQFWSWTVVLLTLVIIALLRPGTEFDKWLKIMAGIVIGVALIGTFFTIQSTHRGSDGRKAHEIGKTLTQNEEAKQTARLAYVERIVTCASTGEDKVNAEWTEKQYSAYHAGCNSSLEAPGIGRDDLRTSWPNAFAALEKYENKKSTTLGSGDPSVQSIVKDSGGATYLSTAYWEQKISEWALKWGWPTVAILLLGHVLLIIWGFLWGGKKIFGNSDASTGSATDKKNAKTSSANIWWLLFLTIIGVGLYYNWDDPFVVKLSGRGASSFHTDAAFNPSMSALELHNWRGSYASVNLHEEYRIPQDVWHGKSVSFFPGSYVADTVNLTVIFDSTNSSMNLSFDGKCVLGNAHVPKVCEGYWNAGNGNVGAYRLEWDDPLGRTFLIKMYATPTLEGNHVKQLRGYLIDDPLKKLGLSE